VSLDATMIRKRRGIVTDILDSRPGYVEVLVMISGKEEKAIVYPDLVGPVEYGDEVVLNTTAVSLGLGTGGFHFVIDIARNSQLDAGESGHIMKLRYTPMQVKVSAVEEEAGPFHEKLKCFESMDGMPVVIALLHSMIPPVFAAIKELSNNTLKTTYIMTDGGALPISFSRLVHDLKTHGLIDSTITCGHAFGGDYECVNIYSALATAKQVTGADIAVVCMGPGIVGTATPFGFTGIEQAQIIDAVNALGGNPIVIPRIGFGDRRKRHWGVSHHTLTVLMKIAHTSSYVALPVTTMGRTMDEEPEFFLAAGAAGVLAYNCLCE
jgi:hypothetical protein